MSPVTWASLFALVGCGPGESPVAPAPVACADSDRDGFSSCDGDCDDEAPGRFPGARERCNGVADDCGDLAAIEQDLDGDGFVGCVGEGTWLGPTGLDPGDCDDADGLVNPGASESCDGVDGDCDGSLGADELDADGDGFVTCTPQGRWAGAPTGFGDCDDALSVVHPGAEERCDGLDGDCDSLPGPGEWDFDGDGVMACVAELGAVSLGSDCDDLRAEVYPGAPERCDGLDDDCDRQLALVERDLDADGFVVCALDPAWSGFPEKRGDDCDDTLAVVHPFAPEVLDGVDDDCDGRFLPEERDDDGDGYVEATVGEGWLGSTAGGDCDDTSRAFSPGAPEGCDGLDEDCDGLLGPDERDADLDGYVGCAYDAATWSGDPPSAGGGDCNDQVPAVNPAAVEVCDRGDNDCDTLVDEDDPDFDPFTLRVFYRDDDFDDFGVTSDSIAACSLPAGYAPNPGDCDDDARHVHPLGREACNGFDDDCDGLADDDDPMVDEDLILDWFEDADGDGQGDPGVAVAQCAPPTARWVPSGTDCDDADATVFLGAVEVCNGLDDDCDRHPDLPAFGGDASELGCDLCTTGADFDLANIEEEKWNPCVLNPLSESLCLDGILEVDTHQNGNRLSRVAWRSDVTTFRPELFIFIPPSKGTFNSNILRWAAHAGYRTVVLSTATEVFLTDTCAVDDETCNLGFLLEAMYGGDYSPDIDVSPADGLNDRLRTLFLHLDTVHPELGFGDFVGTTGELDWSRVIVSGWSKGSPHALFAAQVNPVAGVVMFSSPQEPIVDPVLSPACRNFAIYHEDEPDEGVDWELGFRSMGMDGPTQSFEAADYPWVDDPQIFTTGTFLFDRDDCSAHKAVAFDGCMDDDAIRDDYVDFFCKMGEVDPATCP